MDAKFKYQAKGGIIYTIHAVSVDGTDEISVRCGITAKSGIDIGNRVMSYDSTKFFLQDFVDAQFGDMFPKGIKFGAFKRVKE